MLIMEREADHFFILEHHAPERSTGWKDGFRVDRDTFEVEFFDAEQNKLFAVSPIADLKTQVEDMEDELRFAREGY